MHGWRMFVGPSVLEVFKLKLVFKSDIWSAGGIAYFSSTASMKAQSNRGWSYSVQSTDRPVKEKGCLSLSGKL